MKKFYVLFAAMIIMALLVGCGSATAPAPAPKMDAPDWVDELPPEDAFWGIGIAKLQNESLARDAAQSRARRDVAAQLGVLVQSLLTDYAKESGTVNDSASIQSIERITRELVNVNLTGAIPNAQKRMPDGTWWVRVGLKKADANKLAKDIFESEASRYADFKAAEASRMLDDQLAKAQPQKPTPRAED